MVAGLAGVVLALGQAGGIAKVLPAPTGHNGYEEYVHAAEILATQPSSRLLLSWQPGQQPPEKDPSDPTDLGPSRELVATYARLNSMVPLEVRKEALQRFGRALDLVAQGNQKPVFDPRTRLGPETPFPEYASFKAVSKLALQAVSVYAAAGRTELATKALLDQLWFADSFGRSILISHLVDIACSAIAVAGFIDLLPRLSEADAMAIEKAVDGILARPLAVRASLQAELVLGQTSMDMVIDVKGSAKGLFGSDEDEPKNVEKYRELTKEFEGLSRVGRQKLVETAKARLAASARAMDRVFSLPEKDWIPAFERLAEGSDESPNSLSDALVSMVTPAYTPSVESTVRLRTQLRLLKLYAQAIQYRWEYNAWPTRLDAIDPMNGFSYIYEVREDGTIRIASKGTKDTGEIDLKYKRPLAEEKVQP